MQFDLTPAQRDLQARAREIARGPVAERAAEIDRTEQYPWDNVALLKEAGFFGMTIPAAYGGHGSRASSRRGAGHRGDGEVLRHHRPHRRRGQYGGDRRDHEIRQRGAEAARRRARAVGRQAGDLHHRAGSRQRRERDDDARRPSRQRLVVNGKKHWITGGGVSRLHLIFARVFDERGEEEGIGGFIAIRDETKGLRIGAREPAMGLRGIPEAEIASRTWR